MAVPTGPDLETWVKKGKVDNGGGQRDPGRAIKLKSGWYVPVSSSQATCLGRTSASTARGSGFASGQEGVTGIHWFRDESGGAMSQLNNTGTLVDDGTDGFNEFEVRRCPCSWSCCC